MEIMTIKAHIPVTIIRPDGKRIQYASGKEAAHGENIAQTWVARMCQIRCVYRGFRAEYTQK